MAWLDQLFQACVGYLLIPPLGHNVAYDPWEGHDSIISGVQNIDPQLEGDDVTRWSHPFFRESGGAK